MSDLNEMRQQLADVTAERDELRALLLEVRKKPGFFSGQFVLKIDAALNNSAEVKS